MAVWKLPRVEEEVGLKKSFIYEEVKKGTFPAPIKLTAHAVGWIDEEVIAWRDERIKASRSHD